MSCIMSRTNSDDNNDSSLLDQHAELDYSVNALKQQSAGRNIVPLRHIILISSQPVFSYYLNLRA